MTEASSSRKQQTLHIRLTTLKDRQRTHLQYHSGDSSLFRCQTS
jgi:hypothetical protein